MNYRKIADLRYSEIFSEGNAFKIVAVISVKSEALSALKYLLDIKILFLTVFKVLKNEDNENITVTVQGTAADINADAEEREPETV